MGKEKGNNSSHVYCQAKGWYKRAKKTFTMILERVFKMVWWRRRKWNHIKKDLWSWSVFLLSKYWVLLLIEETLGAFFLFFFFSMLCLLRTWGFWWYLRRKSLLQKPLFKWHDMEWHGHDYGYTGGRRIFQMELCMPIYLNHDYEVCELWIYQWWMHISEWRYARQYFWVRLANNVDSKSFKKKSKLNWTHPLTKRNINLNFYVKEYLALVGMCMSLRNISISFNSNQSQNQGSARFTLTQISPLPTT
jgi:hypothetical protein